MTAEDRRADIAAGLERVRERVTVAADAAGRAAGELTLVVVTKTFPATDVGHLVALGVRDIGENRDQEAAAKVDACAGLGVVWHFVGRLQSNKAHSVARYASVVHSVDRARLAEALGAGARAARVEVTSLVQVSLDGDPRRGGAPADDLPAVAAVVAGTRGLRLGGVMAVPPMGAEARDSYDRLVELSLVLRRDHPDATIVSAGMSGDLEAAVAAGATHLRVGAAVLGSRPPLQ